MATGRKQYPAARKLFQVTGGAPSCLRFQKNRNEGVASPGRAELNLTVSISVRFGDDCVAMPFYSGRVEKGDRRLLGPVEKASQRDRLDLKTNLLFNLPSQRLLQRLALANLAAGKRP